MSGTFYRADDDAPLRQGDILLAPVVRVGPHASTVVGPFDQVMAAVTAPEPQLGNVTLHVGWGPVIVISHDCHLDKEFNRRYTQLRAQQVSKQDAIAAAEADRTLDRWVCVAPLLDPLADAEPDDPAYAAGRAALNGEVVGVLPIPARPDAGLSTAMVADLTWIATIDRHTIVARIASLTAPARTLLRLALARSAALRTPELGFVLEDIVGDRIDGVRRVSDNPLGVELDLRKQGTVRLLAQPGEPPTGGPARTRASAP